MGVASDSHHTVLASVQVVTSIQQVLENKPDNDKLFISAYLDVLLDKAYEQPDDNQKQVRHSWQ